MENEGLTGKRTMVPKTSFIKFYIPDTDLNNIRSTYVLIKIKFHDVFKLKKYGKSIF